MKTTIDIPDPLYKKAKIRAVELGTTLKAVVLKSLEHELEEVAGTPVKSTWANRKLLPAYEVLVKSGALKPRPGDRDITDLISEDRDGN